MQWMPPFLNNAIKGEYDAFFAKFNYLILSKGVYNEEFNYADRLVSANNDVWI